MGIQVKIHFMFELSDVLNRDRLWNGRIFQCTMSITSFIIFIAHSSVLVAFLSAGKSTLPFQSLDELLEKPYFKMILPAGSAVSDSFQANPNI